MDILIVLFIACMQAAPGNSSSTVTSPTNDEYAVYAVLLSERFSPKDWLIIAETSDAAADPTKPFDGARLREEWSPQVVPRVAPGADLVESFGRVRNSPARLDAIRLKVPRQRVISGSALSSRPRDRGYIVISRVGFSRDHTHALVSVSTHCGFLCGEGRYLLLRKEGEAWRIASERPTWVS